MSLAERCVLELEKPLAGDVKSEKSVRKRVEKNRALETSKMFIAMNRFKVIKEERKAFEDLWVTRQSRHCHTEQVEAVFDRGEARLRHWNRLAWHSPGGQ